MPHTLPVLPALPAQHSPRGRVHGGAAARVASGGRHRQGAHPAGREYRAAHPLLQQAAAQHYVALRPPAGTVSDRRRGSVAATAKRNLFAVTRQQSACNAHRVLAPYPGPDACHGRQRLHGHQGEPALQSDEIRPDPPQPSQYTVPLQVLKDAGVPADRIVFCNIVACPEGIRRLRTECVADRHSRSLAPGPSQLTPGHADPRASQTSKAPGRPHRHRRNRRRPGRAVVHLAGAGRLRRPLLWHRARVAWWLSLPLAALAVPGGGRRGRAAAVARPFFRPPPQSKAAVLYFLFCKRYTPIFSGYLYVGCSCSLGICSLTMDGMF